VWLITLATQYENTRYRIFWKDGIIKQVSANKFVTTISCAEITRIVQERSDLQSRMRMRRPLDRIAIHAGQGAQEKHIDVSLRHFTSEDVRKLMRAIHERRPGLTIPEIGRHSPHPRHPPCHATIPACRFPADSSNGTLLDAAHGLAV
jgi:hypothetical protein